MLSQIRYALHAIITAAAIIGFSSIVDAQNYDAASAFGASDRYGSSATNSTPPASTSRYSGGSSQSSIKPLTNQPSTSRAQSARPITSSRQPATSDSQLAPVSRATTAAPTKARVSKGSGKLPNSAGQVWREYDIRPYTLRSGTETRSEQAIVDWILRETGYEAWHSETFGILNASGETLTVYHTPAMQAIVADVVDRFVNSSSSDRAFSMRIVTVRNPDWRKKALGMMTPIPVQSPGLQGWIMPKENYALLMSQLGRRSDMREYNGANQIIANGRKTVFSTMRQRGYVKGIVPTQNAWPGYQPEMGQLDEGASLEFNPLLSMDRTTAEAVVKLRMNQIEKMIPVSLDLPSPTGQAGQRLQVEVPQMTMANLHERFRWPAEQVLILSMGMVATPSPDTGNAFTDMIPVLKSPPRADALLFVEVRDARAPAAGPNGNNSTAIRPSTSFNGRY